MLDNGYPLTTEPNALKEMIAPPTTAGRIAAMVSVRTCKLGEFILINGGDFKI